MILDLKEILIDLINNLFPDGNFARGFKVILSSLDFLSNGFKVITGGTIQLDCQNVLVHHIYT